MTTLPTTARPQPQSRRAYYAHTEFRSSLEARWAIFFDHLGITWKYEPKRYELLTTSYLPDFWLQLPDKTELWFEVKGLSPTASELNAARELATDTDTPVLIAVGLDALDCDADLRLFTPSGKQLLVRWNLTRRPNGPHLALITPTAISAAVDIELPGCHARGLEEAFYAATTHKFLQRRRSASSTANSEHDCLTYQPIMDHGGRWSVGDPWRCPTCQTLHKVALGSGDRLYMSRHMDGWGTQAAA